VEGVYGGVGEWLLGLWNYFCGHIIEKKIAYAKCLVHIRKTGRKYFVFITLFVITVSILTSNNVYIYKNCCLLVLLMNMLTFMARFTLVHVFHKAVQVHDPGPNDYLFSFSACCELSRNVFCLYILLEI